MLRPDSADTTRYSKTGLVLSGGGSRAAYQVGALRALSDFLIKSSPPGQKQPFNVIVGSSIGSINGLIAAACLKNGLPCALEVLDQLWKERSFRNTFRGTPTSAFFRAVRMAVLQYMSPGPNPTNRAIFDPSPLMEKVDSVIKEHGGLAPKDRDQNLEALGVMTTVEGKQRKPLLFLSTAEPVHKDVLLGASFEIAPRETLSAKHGFASAALPSVLPPVELDTERGKVRLVDGGISQNIPVDPAVRFGAQKVIIVDVSGRNWWLEHYGESHDTRPTWEVPAEDKTFCFRPPDTFVARCQKPLGPILKAAVGGTTTRFIKAVGPLWPVFSVLRKKMGEELAYEVISYVALNQDYIHGLIEAGYNETIKLLNNRRDLEFKPMTQQSQM